MMMVMILIMMVMILIMMTMILIMMMMILIMMISAHLSLRDLTLCSRIQQRSLKPLRDYFDSLNKFSSKQKLQQALKSW